MKLLKILSLCLFCIVVYSCKNDDDNSLSDTNPNTNPEVFTENFGNDINRDFLGEVLDKNNNPIHNATVTIGDQTTFTDLNGVFIIRNANIYERFGYVQVDKTGYLHGSRSVVPTSGTNKVKIMLLEETHVGTTSSGTSETIALPNGASVALEGEYIKEDGSAYLGNVNVIMHHLDPTDENMSDQMPGMLYAANAQNEERMLQSFGMLAVELRGSNGEDLNLATGSSAEITVPLDTSLLATAPATIPLWYFDEVAGYWKEEGQATLIGNAYVGTVSHFSFWNCDIPAKAVNLCIIVTDEDGNPVSNSAVLLSSVNYGNTVGYTNDDGEVCGLIPEDENLTVEILPWYLEETCDAGSVFSSSIGPFLEDSTYDLQISINNSYVFETVFGEFMTCDGEPVSSGYVSLNYIGVEFIDFVEDGTFSFNFLNCDDTNTFTIHGYDFDNIQQTNFSTHTFTTPNTDVGTLAACNNVEEFVTYQIDNGEAVTYFQDIQVSLNNPNILRINYSQNQFGTFTLGISDQAIPIGVGSYPPVNTYIIILSDSYTTHVSGTSSINANITTFGNIDEYIDLNFSGTFLDDTGITRDINGTIHAIRDN